VVPLLTPCGEPLIDIINFIDSAFFPPRTKRAARFSPPIPPSFLRLLPHAPLVYRSSPYRLIPARHIRPSYWSPPRRVADGLPARLITRSGLTSQSGQIPVISPSSSLRLKIRCKSTFAIPRIDSFCVGKSEGSSPNASTILQT
jgi:hypothetical protein